MKFPKFIKNNSLIVITSPSLSLDGEYYKTRGEISEKNLKDLGFKVSHTNSTYQPNDLTNNASFKKKADELIEAYKGADLVWSSAGGELMCNTINNIDFEELKKLEPKWFVGFSDNTNFNFLLTTLCDIASIYSYNVTSLAPLPLHKSINDLLEFLKGSKLVFNSYDKYNSIQAPHDKENATIQFIEDSKVEWKSLNNSNESFSGRLIGGCLDILVNIAGSKYDKLKDFSEKYKSDKIVLFFENCELNVLSQLRAYDHLINCGWFNNLAGVIIGRTACKEQCFGYTYETMLHNIFDKFNIPVIYDFDTGHLPPMIPMINGAIINVKLENKKGAIEYKLI